MPYFQLFYHLVWAVWGREPLLTSTVEPTIHALLKSKCLKLEGHVYALDGVEDHVHLVVSIPAKLAVADFVGQVKGAASAQFNKRNILGRPFLWQAEYGAFSLDAKRLPHHVAYVENQKAHHSSGTLIPVLEKAGDGSESA